MARLPNPGSDNGTWGDILNQYLLQSLKPDGAIKDNAVTGSAIAPDAITATEIVDGTIEEAQLSAGVQAKLNQAVPTWTTLSGKPAVVGAGASTAAARSAIGTLSSAEIDDLIATSQKPTIHHDFSNKPDGATATTTDSGQARVTISTPNASGGVIKNGKYVYDDNDAGTAATYFNVDAGEQITYAEADFNFTGNDPDAVSAGLVLMTQTVGPVFGAIPDTAVHTVFCHDKLLWGIFDNGVFDEVASFPYPDVGTSTVHVEVAIDKASATGWARLPNGEVVEFQHALIGSLTHDVVFVEPYYNDATTSDRAEFTKFAADTTPFDNPGGSRARTLRDQYRASVPAGALQRPWTLFSKATSSSSTTLVAVTPTNIPNMAITNITAPSSGVVKCRLSAYVTSFAGDTVYLYVSYAGSSSGAVAQMVSNGPDDESRLYTVDILITDLVAEGLYSFTPVAFSVNGGAILSINPGANLHCFFIVEPVYAP